MLVSLLTVGGGRPEAFALCEKFMQRQTYKGDVQWVFIDDEEKKPTKCSLKQEYYMGPLQWRQGINTQRYNLAYGLSKVRGDYIFFIENDDYYKPEYIDYYLDMFKRSFLVGECNCTYYSLKERSYRNMENFKHASLCQTAFKKSSLPFIEKAIHSGEMYIDIILWNRARAQGVTNILFSGPNLAVGIKGMPGRSGIGVGHRPSEFTPDENDFKLKELVGLDYRLYQPYLAKDFPKIRRNMEKTFAYHKPSQEGLNKVKTLREAFSSLHNLITETCPHTRERSVALTELETTAMWAIKSVVCNDPESVIED